MQSCLFFAAWKRREGIPVASLPPPSGRWRLPRFAPRQDALMGANTISKLLYRAPCIPLFAIRWPTRNDAYERMIKNDVKYRFVIDLASLK
jgi:hypothetical protein